MYDKVGLRIIANHLWDNDPEVRSAARKGLKQLGDTDAIPLLEQAASQTQNDDEAADLQEVIRFLQTPSLNVKEYLQLANQPGSDQ